MKVHLVDGTYELFRAHFALPSISAPDGREVGAVRGLVQTLINLLRQPDVTHVAVAFDTEILSFRNQLFAGYKTGEGTPPELLEQFPLAERAAAALGLVVWPMVEFEADDALGAAAVRFRDAPGVEQMVLCSPDKDLAQVVNGDRVVTLDRRREIITNEAGVREKFGVAPASIPDYLGLGGRQRRRHPRHPPLGRQKRRPGPRPLRPHRADSPRRRRLDHHRPRRQVPGRQPHRKHGSSPPLSPTGHPPPGRPHC